MGRDVKVQGYTDAWGEFVINFLQNLGEFVINFLQNYTVKIFENYFSNSQKVRANL